MKAIILIIVLMFSGIGVHAEKKDVPIITPPPTQTPPPNKPYAPVRINVEAWLEENILTILFHQSEGDATITLDNVDGYDSVDFTFTTDTPILIDLTPYTEVVSFTIKTSTEKTYIGYLY